MITIHDLQTPESAAVIQALKRECGMCHVPKGTYCHPVGIGKKLVGLVHIARATAHYKEAKGEK